jgi:hypothetical protein
MSYESSYFFASSQNPSHNSPKILSYASNKLFLTIFIPHNIASDNSSLTFLAPDSCFSSCSFKNNISSTRSFVTSKKSFILLIIVIFTLTSISDNPSRLELFNTPSVISHRGGGNYAPENTLVAIKKGIELGADAVEIDIRFTSDGVPILIHDATLSRTTNDVYNRSVSSLTLEEIKMLDAGSWFSEEFTGEKIPTLIEVIEEIGNDIDLFIELKTTYPNSDEIIVSIIEEASIESHIKILSFDSNL